MNYLRFVPPVGFLLVALDYYRDGHDTKAIVMVLTALGLVALHRRSLRREDRTKVSQQRFNDAGDLE